MDPWLHVQHRLPFPSLARRGGGDMQSVAYILEDNRVRPSHQRILNSCLLQAVIDCSITKRGVYRRKGGGGEVQTKQGLVEPPSSISLKDEEGICRPLLVSIVYASACWWELAGRLPSGRDLQCRCLLQGKKKKKMHHEQMVVLKGTQSSKGVKKKKKKLFVKAKAISLGGCR